MGDTIIKSGSNTSSLPGFKEINPQVYAALFPQSSDDFEAFRESLEKLCINDAALQYEPEQSDALGAGFRCGFLGLLHMEIIRERLTREFNLELISTAPSVVYEIKKVNGEIVKLHNPADLPDANNLDHIQEPWITATIFVPDQYLGSVLTLCTERRGEQVILVMLEQELCWFISFH